MLQLEVLILELATVDTLAASAITILLKLLVTTIYITQNILFLLRTVKSPPWIMKSLITLWKVLPL